MICGQPAHVSYAPNAPVPRTASGWAVVDGSGINVKTVSDTKRAAMVNWLVVKKKILILASDSDEEIQGNYIHESLASSEH